VTGNMYWCPSGNDNILPGNVGVARASKQIMNRNASEPLDSRCGLRLTDAIFPVGLTPGIHQDGGGRVSIFPADGKRPSLDSAPKLFSSTLPFVE